MKFNFRFPKLLNYKWRKFVYFLHSEEDPLEKLFSIFTSAFILGYYVSVSICIERFLFALTENWNFIWECINMQKFYFLCVYIITRSVHMCTCAEYAWKLKINWWEDDSRDIRNIDADVVW